jgi:hypothetical protein
MAGHRRELQRENESLKSQMTEMGDTVKGFTAFKDAMMKSAEEAGLEYDPDIGFKEPEDTGFDYSEFGEIPESPEDYARAMTPPKGVNKELWTLVQGQRMASAKHLRSMFDQNKNLTDSLDTIKNELNHEREVRTQAEQAARNASRTSILDRALEQANCLDLEGGKRYFEGQTEWIEGRGWVYKPRGWNGPQDYVAIDEGIKKEIPAYLVRNTAVSGGSGSTGSEGANANSGSNNSISSLQQMKTQMEEIRERAAQDPRNAGVMAAYQSAKRRFYTAVQEAKQSGVDVGNL